MDTSYLYAPFHWLCEKSALYWIATLDFHTSIFQVLSSGSKLGSANQIPLIRLQRSNRVNSIFLPLLAVAAVKKGHNNINLPTSAFQGYLQFLGFDERRLLAFKESCNEGLKTMAHLVGQ